MDATAAESALARLLGDTPAPVYAVDARGVITFANRAACEWVGLASEAVVGRSVEYHSETSRAEHAGPLSGLCPPPSASAGQSGEGAVSTMSRDGRLRHRQARFLSLQRPDGEAGPCPVVVLCDAADMTPQELAAKLTDDPSHDELHREVRRFRRALGEPDAETLLLGASAAARKLQRQFDLAVASGADAVVVSPCAADAEALARAVHYARGDAQTRLVPIDCLALDAEEALRGCDTAIESAAAGRPTTLLLLDAAAATRETQQAIAERTLEADERPRVLATLAPAGEKTLAPELEALVGGLRIQSPSLCERVEDLPVVCQALVERANVGAARQVGGLAPDAVDLVALYAWPQGVGQLAEAVAAAHAQCAGPTITPDNLPTVVRHAALAAAQSHEAPPSIVLDKLLARIERELVQRALAEAEGNKAEAARLLGMTRPRLYRRLERLGLTAADDDAEPAGADDA